MFVMLLFMFLLHFNCAVSCYIIRKMTSETLFSTDNLCAKSKVLNRKQIVRALIIQG